jgi:hypothetical protein
MALWIPQKQGAAHHGLLQRQLSQFVWLPGNFRVTDHLSGVAHNFPEPARGSTRKLRGAE